MVGEAIHLHAAWKAVVDIHEAAKSQGESGMFCNRQGVTILAKKLAVLRHTLAKAILCFLVEKLPKGKPLGEFAKELFGEDADAFMSFGKGVDG